MKLSAFEIEQNCKKFYVTYMSVEQLCDERKVKADIWSIENREGYQRGLDAIRARIFAKFIVNQDNISPTTLLLSVRDPVEFKPKEANYGILTLPDSSILYEVDGQHRIGGLREALRKGEFSAQVIFPVIIICPAKLGEKEARNPRFSEAKQFVIINRTQKTVRADLSDRFIARLTPEQREELDVLWKIEELERTQKAVQIVDDLIHRSGSPWENRIRLPDRRIGIVSQRAFTNSLDTILREPMIGTLSYDEIADALNEYWIAWKSLCERTFNEPQHYVIQKTIGVTVLHELFIEAAKLLKSRGKDWTQDNFYNVLDKMTRGISDDFWSSHGDVARGGTGKPHLRLLSRSLRENFLSCNWQ